MIRENPSLKGTLPNCSYDEVSEHSLEQNNFSQQSLAQLEARVGM